MPSKKHQIHVRSFSSTDCGPVHADLCYNVVPQSVDDVRASTDVDGTEMATDDVNSLNNSLYVLLFIEPANAKTSPQSSLTLLSKFQLYVFLLLHHLLLLLSYHCVIYFHVCHRVLSVSSTRTHTWAADAPDVTAVSSSHQDQESHRFGVGQDSL